MKYKYHIMNSVLEIHEDLPIYFQNEQKINNYREEINKRVVDFLENGKNFQNRVICSLKTMRYVN